MKPFTALFGIAVATASASSASAKSQGSASHSKHYASAGAQLDYTSTLDASGILRFSGTDAVSGKSFRLRVSRNGFVSGTIDRKPVKYFVPREQRDRAVASLSKQLAAKDGSATSIAGAQ